MSGGLIFFEIFFRTAVHHTVCFSSRYLDQSTQETSLLAAAFALLPESQTCQIGFLCSITQNKFDELKTVSFELDFRRFLYREGSWVRTSVLRGCSPDSLLNLWPLSGMWAPARVLSEVLKLPWNQSIYLPTYVFCPHFVHTCFVHFMLVWSHICWASVWEKIIPKLTFLSP